MLCDPACLLTIWICPSIASLSRYCSGVTESGSCCLALLLNPVPCHLSWTAAGTRSLGPTPVATLAKMHYHQQSSMSYRDSFMVMLRGAQHPGVLHLSDTGRQRTWKPDQVSIGIASCNTCCRALSSRGDGVSQLHMSACLSALA